MLLNFGCGPHLAPEPWLNIDAAARPGVPQPNLVVESGPLPFDDGSVTKFYAGHVMEHLPLTIILEILADWRRVIADDGGLVVVGPDVDASLDLFKAGKLSKAHLWEQMEHGTEVSQSAWQRNYGDEVQVDPYARHWWNCTPTRVIPLLQRAGFRTVSPVPITSRLLDSWPLVSRVNTQFAVMATG